MAQRKMSEVQREAIRKEIRRGLAKKKESSEILKAVAEKYKITVATARWYLKSLSGKAPSRKTRKKNTSKSRKKSLGRRKAAASNGQATGLFALVQKVSEAKLKLALQAKRLVPALNAQLRKAASLKKLEKKVKSSLKAVSARADRIKKKIRKLTAG